MSRRRALSRSALWSLPALIASVVVYAAYLLTHPYPATGGGLYLAMAEAIREGGYHLPARVPHYTDGGIPFAYPPLMFYVLAFVRDAFGVGPLALTRYLPGIVTVLYVIPVYLLGREVLGDDRRAGFAALVVAVSPAVLAWHLSAGGVVRAPAYLFTVLGLVAGVRLFRDGEWIWAVPGAVLFGLTLLTHPSYPVFFGTSYLLFFAYFDRSPAGFRRGAAVALGGFLLAAPWGWQVLSTHGVDVFTRTAGTRLGIGQGVVWFTSKFLYGHRTRFLAVWHAIVLLGIASLAVRRRYFLPLWFVVTALMFPKPRFLMLVGAFVVAAAVFRWLPSSTDRGTGAGSARRDRAIAIGLLALLATYGVATGALYAANYEPIPDRALDRLQGEPLPTYIDDEDVEAMTWARENTASDATFLVADDTAEWFPLFAERTTLYSPWGAEWLPTDERRKQTEGYHESATCASAACVENVTAGNPRPDYVYLSRDGSRSWIAREEWTPAQWDELIARVDESNRTEVAFRNRDVAIVRVRADAEGRRGTGQSSALAAPETFPSGTVPSSFQPRSS